MAPPIPPGGKEAVTVTHGHDTHERQGWMWLDRLFQDARYAWRLIRKTPGFALTTMLVLALGIGANTAIFTFVSGVVLKPLGYPKPEQLISLTTQFPLLRFATYGFAPSEYMQFREINRSFAQVGAFTTGEVNITTDERPLRVRAAWVDEHLLRTLGLQPAEGRFYRDGETIATGATPPAIAILSHELWRSAFGGQPIVGRTVNINGRAREILGIMPPGADLMDNRTEVWMPLGLRSNDRNNNGSHYLGIIGRLKDGVALDAAQTELNALMGNWAERVGGQVGSGDGDVHVPTTRPQIPVDHLIVMDRVQSAMLGNAGRSIWVLQAAVGVVLLIACANLASLFVARAETRRREFAVRTALGASRGRLLRQAMTEGIVLSLAGGAIGVWLARLGVQALIRAYPTSLPRTSEVAIDLPVLLFASAVAIVTGVFFGVIPLAHNRLTGVVTALKDSGDRGSSSARHALRRGLVMLEVALAVVLVAGAGLLMRTVYNLTTVDAGFDRSRLVTFSMTLSQPKADVRTQSFQRVLDRLRATPGVEAASAMSGLPPNREANGRGTFIENHVGPQGKPIEIIDYYQIVLSDYFNTLGIPIVEGRGFEPSDAGQGNRVAVVNETMAQTIWKGRSAIGQRLQPGTNAPDKWYTVIGVAKDVKQGGLDQKTGSEIYLLAEQQGGAPQTMHVVLRTGLATTALSKTVETVVREVDPTVPIARFRDMDTVFAASIRRPRLLAQLLGAFAGLALLLAAVGTYGVLAYVVTERRREIGIRMALGAGRTTVLAQVLKEGLQLTAIGLVVGLVAALGLNRFMATLLFGVAPTDLLTLAVVMPIIAIVAVVASALPAWRASRLDPSVVLRDG